MAASIATSKALSRGLYSVPEAALYARISPATVRRWVGGKPGRTVSFLDLVELLAIREIRFQRDLPLRAFRRAADAARRESNAERPFARRHTTFLDENELVIRVGETAEPTAFVELCQRDLRFNADGLAVAWTAFTSKEGVPIVLAPELRLGEPLLPSGYTPFAAWDAIRSEGGVAAAAEAFGIVAIEVLAAYQYVVDHLNQRPSSKRAA